MDPTHINVGGRKYTSLRSTVTQSPLLTALLSDDWSVARPHTIGIPFVDRNPVLFEHVLEFLRTSFPPVFWSPLGGFDLSLYASLLREAEYFQLHALADWIREAGYATTVRITPSVSRELLTDCERGLFWHTGCTRKHFETGTLSTVSNSGRSTTHWKRVHVQTVTLHPPCNGQSPCGTCTQSSYSCRYSLRKFCDMKSKMKSRMPRCHHSHISETDGEEDKFQFKRDLGNNSGNEGSCLQVEIKTPDSTRGSVQQTAPDAFESVSIAGARKLSLAADTHYGLPTESFDDMSDQQGSFHHHSMPRQGSLSNTSVRGGTAASPDGRSPQQSYLATSPKLAPTHDQSDLSSTWTLAQAPRTCSSGNVTLLPKYDSGRPRVGIDSIVPLSQSAITASPLQSILYENKSPRTSTTKYYEPITIAGATPVLPVSSQSSSVTGYRLQDQACPTDWNFYRHLSVTALADKLAPTFANGFHPVSDLPTRFHHQNFHHSLSDQHEWSQMLPAEQHSWGHPYPWYTNTTAPLTASILSEQVG